MIRVLPHWKGLPHPALAPKYWAETRKRLDPVQLANEYGSLDVPDEFPHLPAPEEQSTTD